VPSPSRAAQKEEKVLPAPQVTADCAHDAETLVKEPAAPVAAYPAQFALATLVTVFVPGAAPAPGTFPAWPPVPVPPVPAPLDPAWPAADPAWPAADPATMG
jgi:hypothetical protein